MLNNFLISRKETGNLRLTSKIPFELTPEKIVTSPRSFTTAQIKSAIENINVIGNEELINEDLINIANFIIKNLFFQMHQTGLYNRQLKLWKSLGNTTQILFYKLEKGLLKKSEMEISLIDFLVDANNTSCTALFVDLETLNPDKLTSLIDLVLEINNKKGIKGLFVVLTCEINDDFTKNLEKVISMSDQTSKYESIILNTNEVRLNVISLRKENGRSTFKHVFPVILG